MEGEHQPPPYREEYPPAVDSYNRGPPGPAPPGNYGAPPHDAYPLRDPTFQEPEHRGRRPHDNRDRGGYGGSGYGAPRARSRSRSPPGGGGGYGRNGGGGGGEGGYYQGPPPQSRGGGGGDYQYRQDVSATGVGGQRPERKAVQSIEPMDSYKVFMMRQDENSTPETYQQRYEEYKKKYTQRLLRAFFDDHKTEEWLQERYSPAIRFRVDQQKRTAKIAEAKQFVERIVSGVATINMDERESELTGSDYENDLEDSKRILYVRRVPCACPVATLSEAIKKAGGNFQHIYLSDPVKKSTFDFDRSAYIIYESAEAAAEALPKIHNTFVQDGDLFTPVRLQVSQHRSRAPIKTPSYLSVPDRLANDYKQALTLASLLDKALFVKESDLQSAGIEALLEDPAVTTAYASDKQKLDVVVAYLRRVHHYIYYAAVQCIDMGDIMHAHPALFCRPPPTTKDLEEEKVRKDSVGGADEAGEQKGGWAASLDEKVQAYIEELSPENVSAKLEKNKNLVDEIESREEAALESTYANYAEKAGDDGKHRCRLCTKLFKSMEFVKKHIRNKHPELVEDKVAEVGESYMWEQYREDANRPLPPIETTNTLSNPTLGGRGGSSYQGRSGPGGARGGYGGGPPGNRGGGYSRDGPGYRGGYGGPPQDNRPRRGSFGDNRGGGGGDRRSPPRPYNRPPPDGDLPVDPRQVSRSYQDLDNLQDAKVELSFDALDSLPPPKKKTKV